MTAILQTLAGCFAAAAAGRRGGARDFLIDYEKLLRQAGAADGDERELAEAELLRAAADSAGMLEIDRAPRSGLPERVRVARHGGEAWLFERIESQTPGQGRLALARIFETAGTRVMAARWRDGWEQWCGRLAAAALTGSSLAPFKRDDPDGAVCLLDAVAGVLNWEGESLLPYASAQICGDSKRLKALEGRVLQGLEAVTGAPISLERFGILEKPRAVWVHGPLELDFADAPGLHLTLLPGAVALSEANLAAATTVRTTAAACVTVENEAVFLELVKRNPGVLLVWTSFAGSGVLRLLGRLPAGLPCHHFGDTDPSGFEILRDLRERSGRHFSPLLMHPRPAPESTPFDDRDRQTLLRLLSSSLMHDLHEPLAAYLAGGGKGRFEQELVPLAQVLDALQGILHAS